MAKSFSVGTVFTIRKLVRQYGSSSDAALDRLSISETVSPPDAFLALVNLTSYKTVIVRLLFQRRSDFDEVKKLLRDLVRRVVEVVPVFFIFPKSHRTVYVYIYYFYCICSLNL